MTLREKLLFVWLLTMFTLSFLVSHFWSCTFYLIQRGAAWGLLPLLILSKLAAALLGVPHAS